MAASHHLPPLAQTRGAPKTCGKSSFCSGKLDLAALCSKHPIVIHILASVMDSDTSPGPEAQVECTGLCACVSQITACFSASGLMPLLSDSSGCGREEL